MPNGKNKKGKKASFTPKQVKRLKSIAKSVETKHHDESGTSRFANDGTTVMLSDVPQGSSSQQREGLKLLAKSLEMRFVIQWTAAQPYEACRVIVVRDRAPDYALPVITDLLEDNTLDSVYSNTVGLRRFTIVHDKYYHNPNPTRYWDSQANAEVGVPFQRAFKAKHKLNNNIEYIASTAASDELGKGNLYMMLISDTTTASVAGPSISYHFRLNYIDI